MKASQAKEFKPLIDGLAAGETWQQSYGPDDWRDIRPGEFLVLHDPKNYRKKPEPRRGWLIVRDVAKLDSCVIFLDKIQADDCRRANETLVEFVEVIK